jgi:cephalosporin-C deacetylase-like acetyl esterase
MWIDLAKEGFMVLTFDPPGQGERLMYWDQDLGQTWLEGTTTEHSLPGIQCLVTGSSAATYFIWDMIRCLDYLESRPEVDRERLAVTGNSGGGMMSAYIAAVDTRLAAAVPSCYMTSWRRLWATIGPQDAEQNMLPFIGSGLDFGDYVLAFAPKPYLMNTAIRDFFSIAGARQTLTEAKRIYGILGAEDKVAQFEADDYHGYTKLRREACVRWLRKHLLGVDEAYVEGELALEKERDLWATPTGQTLTSFKDTETIGTLNAKLARRIMYQPGMPSSESELAGYRESLVAKIKELTGFVRPTGELDLQLRGYVRRPGMTVEQLTYRSEPGIEIPALLCRPDNPAGELPAVLYAPAEGKADEIGDDISALTAAGHIVLVPDVRGKGETSRPSKRDNLFQKWFSADWDMAMMAFQVRKSLVGMRAQDLIRAVDVLKKIAGEDKKVVAVGKGAGVVPLLHAAAFDTRIAGVAAQSGLVSWKAVVEAKYHLRQLDNVVLGALACYDLPSLAVVIAPRPLVFGNTADPMGNFIPADKAAILYGEARHCYELTGGSGNLVFIDRQEGLGIRQAYGAVLGK